MGMTKPFTRSPSSLVIATVVVVSYGDDARGIRARSLAEVVSVKSRGVA
jgi:hypothetical protein